MEWISVKDRFPEDGKKVLLTDGKYIYVGHYSDYKDPRFDNTFYFCECCTGLSINLTHWMEFPELPNIGE